MCDLIQSIVRRAFPVLCVLALIVAPSVTGSSLVEAENESEAGVSVERGSERLAELRKILIEAELEHLWHLGRFFRDDRFSRYAYQVMNVHRKGFGRENEFAEDAELKSAGTLELEVLRRQLDDQETLLSYYMGTRFIYLFVLNRNETHLERVGSSRNVRWLYEIFQFSVKEEDKDLYRSLASTLYEEILEPVVPFFHNTEKLLVLPDGPLYNLPFEMLLSHFPEEEESFRWPFLLKEYQIRYASSFELFASNRYRESFGRGGGLLALAPWANPELNEAEPDLPPLPLSKYEAEQIATIFQQGVLATGLLRTLPSVTILINEEANLESLARMDLSVYSYFHLASHAEIDETNPEASSLIFSGPNGETQRLRLKDLKGIDLDADLVALAGCETARGKLVSGQGIHGFTRTLIEQGVRNLLVSVWDVEDRYTAKLMIRFYQQKANGASMAEALQMAKLSLLEDSLATFPSAWGAFVLITG